MAERAGKEETYEDLCGLPEDMIGEIIDGELIVTSRPFPRHGYTANAPGTEVTFSCRFGRGGGPGGWIILVEPEIELIEECRAVCTGAGGMEGGKVSNGDRHQLVNPFRGRGCG